MGFLHLAQSYLAKDAKIAYNKFSWPMSAISYRDYLEIFEKYHKDSISIVKSLAALSVIITLVFAISVFITTKSNKQVEPINQQAAYFNSANSSFYKTKQSLDSLVSSFQVAGTKTQNVDSSQSSPSASTPGFFITLGDTQNLIAQIKSTKENIQTEEDLVKKLETPDIYKQLSQELVAYQDQAQIFLNHAQDTQEQLKDLILAAGPNFYQPSLSDESVWKTQESDKIKIYYESKKMDAKKALGNFSKLSVTPALQSYFSAQLSYFQLVINVSDNILKTLNKPTDTNVSPDTLSNIEESYQLLSSAQKDNEIIAQKLLDERLKLMSTAEIENQISSLNDKSAIIDSAFSDGNKIVSAQLKNQENRQFQFPIFKNIENKFFNFTDFTK